MDNETIKILEEQAKKMPPKVIDFLSSFDWESVLNNTSASHNLSFELSNKLKKEVVLVLAGLIHPDAFREEIKERIGGDETTIDAIVAEIEENIFTPIRADLMKFFEEQEVVEEGQEEVEKKEAEQAPSQAPAKTWEKMLDVAPENLPVGDESEISFIPTLIPKTRLADTNAVAGEEGEPHPFEEKMKKVFTGAGATMGDLAIETPAQEKNISISSDPYREQIE